MPVHRPKDKAAMISADWPIGSRSSVWPTSSAAAWAAIAEAEGVRCVMAGAFSLLRANDTRDKVETRPAIPNARLSGRPQLRAQPHRHRCGSRSTSSRVNSASAATGRRSRTRVARPIGSSPSLNARRAGTRRP